MSLTVNCSNTSTAILASISNHRQQPMHLTVEESLLHINNDGVSLLQAGKYETAMIRLARCLAVMRNISIEGDKAVHYRFMDPIRKTSLQENSNLGSSYTFAAPLQVVCSSLSHCSTCSPDDGEEPLTCKLLSLVLFNLSLAYHLYSQELIEEALYNSGQERQQKDQICAFLQKAMRLYELCHSSLIFTNSGLLCSDLSIAVVVTNNVGEIHKELHRQSQQSHENECSKAAKACSEQLIQIFMFFAANGEPKRLEGFGNILSNAMATLNGSQIVAPAA